MLKLMQKCVRVVALASPIVLVSLPTYAVIDTSAVTGALTDASAAIAIVGLAYLAMIVGARVFKWIKTAV